MNISIFDNKWTKYLPKKLSIVTSNGDFELKMPDKSTQSSLGHATNVTNLSNCIQIAYWHDTVSSESGDVLRDGEPDLLEFDITFVKTNTGEHSNPDTLKLNIDLSYGDAMVSQFSIENENGNSKVIVGHYTGIGSKFDKETHFGFTDESLKELVTFFNRFGYKLTTKDFTFIDKYPDTYSYVESIQLSPTFNDKTILVINNTKPQENKYLINVLNYFKVRGIECIVASSPEEVDKNIENVIGCVTTGSEYRINKPQSNREGAANKHALSTLKCPVLGLSYGMHSMAKENGCQIKTGNTLVDDNVLLTQYDKHPLFNGVDLSNTQVSFSFNDYLEDCPQGFKSIAKRDDKIAGIADDSKKHYGLLFHPEDIESTHKILDNFVDICKKGKSEDPINTNNDMKYIQTFESFRRLKHKK